MERAFGVSDHSLGIAVPIAAAALGPAFTGTNSRWITR